MQVTTEDVAAKRTSTSFATNYNFCGTIINIIVVVIVVIVVDRRSGNI